MQLPSIKNGKIVIVTNVGKKSDFSSDRLLYRSSVQVSNGAVDVMS
jgi:hypothetical protein